jgi:hypothetical protein
MREAILLGTFPAFLKTVRAQANSSNPAQMI